MPPSTAKTDGKVAPFSTEAFLAFCRSKPRGERYAGGNPRLCALAQFGFPNVITSDLDALAIPCRVYAAICERPHAFGDLSVRLSILAQGPSS